MNDYANSERCRMKRKRGTCARLHSMHGIEIRPTTCEIAVLSNAILIFERLTGSGVRFTFHIKMEPSRFEHQFTFHIQQITVSSEQ